MCDSAHNTITIRHTHSLLCFSQGLRAENRPYRCENCTQKTKIFFKELCNKISIVLCSVHGSIHALIFCHVLTLWAGISLWKSEMFDQLVTSEVGCQPKQSYWSAGLCVNICKVSTVVSSRKWLNIIYLQNGKQLGCYSPETLEKLQWHLQTGFKSVCGEVGTYRKKE